LYNLNSRHSGDGAPLQVFVAAQYVGSRSKRHGEKERWAISFDALFELMGNHGANKPTNEPRAQAFRLLLYSLLHGCPEFCEFVNARSDLDTLVVPLLQLLHRRGQPGGELQLPHLYTVLIILLQLSQDSAFGESTHTRLLISSVNWFNEATLLNCSLGSLMMTVLLRVIQLNLGGSRDLYLHTNSLAALANMSHCCKKGF